MSGGKGDAGRPVAFAHIAPPEALSGELFRCFFGSTTQMNLLWLAHAIPYPPKAGFLLRSYNLLRELAKRQTVDLIAFVQEPWMRTLFPTLEQGILESRAALNEFCRTVTFLPIESVQRPLGKERAALSALLRGDSYTGSWLVSAAAGEVIAAQLRATQYDVVHFDTIGLAPYRPLVQDTVATTLTHHNIESHLLFRRAENTTNPAAKAYFRLEGRRVEALERGTAASFAAHITCSQLDSARLRRIVPGARSLVVPNGVDCDYFRPNGNPIRPNSLIFVGTMNWYPNVDAMLFFLKDIWPLLKARIPTLTLDIAGSNPPAVILELGKSLPGVTVHGYVPDIRPLLDSAAIFVCPIRDGGGTKLKILDAFAMGKCVVAHPIACEGINATAGHEVVHARTPEEYEIAITSLLNDENRTFQIGSAARQLVERDYSFRAIGTEFSATMESLARSNQVH